MPRRRREVTDWVYNMSSYSNNGASLLAGPGGALVFPLTISQNARRLSTFGGNLAVPSAGSYESWSAIPEGGKQKVYEVRGYLRIDPTTWNVGSEFALGWRLAHFDMFPATGGAAVPADYSMWVNANAGGGSAAQFANMGFLKEHRMAESALGTAVSTRGEWIVPVRWSSSRGITLGGGRALYLWVETIPGSIALRTSLWCGARMAVRGG